MSLPTLALTRGTFHAALLALLCVAEPAHSEPRLEGRFQGRGEGLLTLRVADVSTDQSRPEYYVTADIAVPNECTGSVGGLAALINPSTLRLRQKSEGAEQTCEVTLRFSPDRSRVTMSAQSCSDSAECLATSMGRSSAADPHRDRARPQPRSTANTTGRPIPASPLCYL